MLVLGELEKCKRYIESHSNEKRNDNLSRGICITISRETGTCAKLVSEELINFFQKRSGENEPSWTIFDKNLIEKVLEDHHLPEILKSLMYEDKISFFSSMLNEMFSGFPGTWTLVHKTGQTILQLASLGNVIIIGRGGNIITQNLNNTFHVRLVAPLYERVKTFAEFHKIDYRKAKSLIEQHDLSRMKYVHSIFNKKIDDPSLYHLFINTKGLTCKQIANIIGSAVIHRFPEKYKTFTNALQIS